MHRDTSWSVTLSPGICERLIDGNSRDGRRSETGSDSGRVRNSSALDLLGYHEPSKL